VAARFSLDGNIIPRQVKRLFDQRAEPRIEPEACTATLVYRGRHHQVSVANYSESGAMVFFKQVPHIGEILAIDIPGRGPLHCQVQWVRGGRVGLILGHPIG
jgi:hypothetical protein